MISARSIVAIAGSAAALAFSAPVVAGTVDYDVSDYNVGSSCSHGMWTNTRSGGCSKYFSFQDGSEFSVDSDSQTASFTGTAINSLGETATLNLSLSGYLDTLDGSGFVYKRDGGDPYDPSVMDFFTAGTGTIDIDGQSYQLSSDPFAGSTVFQYGEGANAKTGAFGGSAWINVLDPSGASLPHWDLNFNLSERPTEVPAPGGLLLFGLGAAAVWSRGRRRKGKAATA